MEPPAKIRLVIFDWAGTTVDHGCFAPVVPFVTALDRFGVSISATQARGPMGLRKKDHVRELLKDPEASRQWRQRHGRAWTESDVDDIYQNHFVELQLGETRNHSRLVGGLLETTAALRASGIKIGTTTGYFREAAELVCAVAAEQGYRPDFNVCPEDVPRARPAPWMIYRNMEGLGIYPPASVVKVGDTVPDIEEGRNAGVWSVGVLRTGSLIAMSEEEFSACTDAEQAQMLQAARTRLLEAGAHDVIESVGGCLALVARIESRLAKGERP